MSKINWAVSAQAIAGETESGDQYIIRDFENGTLISVIDGLGHGSKAHQAALSAVKVLDQHVGSPVTALLTHCHERLRGSRGVVMSLASFHHTRHELTWLGVGNVRGLLLHADPAAPKSRQWLLLRGGVVGYQLPTLRPVTVPVVPGDTLIFTTDGIKSGFADQLALDGQGPEQIADYIFEAHRRGTDDTLVLVAQYKA